MDEGYEVIITIKHSSRSGLSGSLSVVNPTMIREEVKVPLSATTVLRLLDRLKWESPAMDEMVA